MLLRVIGHFMNAPTTTHLKAAYCVLQILKKNPHKGLLHRKMNSFKVTVYTNTKWARSFIDRRSTSGNCTFVGRNLITWKSKKQSTVTRLSAKT